jgi:hypothetical protein
LVDELLAGARGEEEIVGPGGLLADLTRRLVERALSAELTEHLGYEPHAEPPGGTGNTRNGTTPRTLVTEHGPVRIGAPRDRKGHVDEVAIGADALLGSFASRQAAQLVSYSGVIPLWTPRRALEPGCAGGEPKVVGIAQRQACGGDDWSCASRLDGARTRHPVP